MDSKARRQAEAKVDMSLDDIIKMQKKQQMRSRNSATVKVNASKRQTRVQPIRQQQVSLRWQPAEELCMY
jgi:hypothetical protein